MQTKTMRRLANPYGAKTVLIAENEIQHVKVALRARRKRQRQNRKAGRASR